ncbi:MAG: IclR family transcriptional regulator [Jatrophihabitans sp.]
MTTNQVNPDETAGNPPSMVERITLIMDAFERRTTVLTLEQVTVRTGLPRSTAHRILDQLVQRSWLVHTSSGYFLGSRALSFGGQDGTQGEIRAAAASVIQDLVVRTGLVVHLAVLDGPDTFYLDKCGGNFAFGLPSCVGGRVPAHTTAVGKVILAWTPPEDVDEALGERLTRRTTRSIGDSESLHRELARIRLRHGLAYENGESVPGVACVAAAIRGPHSVAAGISVCGPSQAVRLEAVGPLVLDAAREVSRRLYPALGKPRSMSRADGRQLTRAHHAERVDQSVGTARNDFAISGAR